MAQNSSNTPNILAIEAPEAFLKYIDKPYDAKSLHKPLSG